MSQNFDTLIIGAGAAGLMCALTAGARGRRVVVVDHAPKVGGKILISGGGRCNFTNIGASPEQFVSKNPHFCKSALARYTSEDFLNLVKKHKIPFHEKKLGQLFCTQSARDIVQMLMNECQNVGVQIRLDTVAPKLARSSSDQWVATWADASIESFSSVVIATGGYSIPKLGATGWAFDFARSMGIKVTETRPALDGFTFSDDLAQHFRALSGVAMDIVVSINDQSFRENLLFTHAGLSGPAALQASLHWNPGDVLMINTLPEIPNPYDWLVQQKQSSPKKVLKTVLTTQLPERFVDYFLSDQLGEDSLNLPQILMTDIADQKLREITQKLTSWSIKPLRTVGYHKAEVTKGGVSTDELSSKTMESRKQPGLYFIGECIDVTGWLGGYNFQWAWSSGWVAGQHV